MQDHQSRLPRIVIVGAGFGGMHAARALGRANADVTLVDKRNFTLFQPLLYQVATATLAAADIATPIRGELRQQKNTVVYASTARDIDVEKQIVKTAHGELFYDHLIVATGVKYSYFGNNHWRTHAPGIKTVEHALEMRRRIFKAFELAEIESDPVRREALLTFVIIGAGPTGVELAGTLAELARGPLHKEYRRYDSRDARVVLVEGADSVLPPYPERLREAARHSLHSLGVEVMTGTMATDIQADHVLLKRGETESRIDTRTVLWAAGVQRSRFGEQLAKATQAECERGRFVVGEDLSLPSHPNIFVIGDLAHRVQDGEPLPGIAPVAKQQGRFVGKLLAARLAGRREPRFHYRNNGTLAVIGARRAVADLPWARLTGFSAWFIWAFVHIAFLIRIDQRLSVMLRWAYKYLFQRRAMRLITGKLGDGEGDGVTPLGSTGAVPNPPELERKTHTSA